MVIVSAKSFEYVLFKCILTVPPIIIVQLSDILLVSLHPLY